MGVEAHLFTEDDVTEKVASLQLRGLATPWLGFDIAYDFVWWGDPLLSLLGMARVGTFVSPFEGSWRPYAFARVGYLLGPAETEDRHVWNVGAHYTGGAALQWSSGELGIFVEAGVLGDFAGRFLVPSFAAGALYHFGG
jgi:hypothetical protein